MGIFSVIVLNVAGDIVQSGLERGMQLGIRLQLGSVQLVPDLNTSGLSPVTVHVGLSGRIFNRKLGTNFGEKTCLQVDGVGCHRSVVVPVIEVLSVRVHFALLHREQENIVRKEVLPIL
jgi:hypothetical protein